MATAKTKVVINSIFGQVIWESEKETREEAVIEKYQKDKDLSNMDLSNLHFKEFVDFSGANCNNSRFDNSSFDNSRFDNSRFDNSRFYNSSFDNSSFDNSRFYNSSFDNSRFYNSRFDNSSFYNSRFDNSSFDNSSFYNSRFDNSRFYNSRFDNSRFDNSSFDNSSFYNSRFDNMPLRNFPQDWINKASRDLLFIFQQLKSELPFLKQKLIEGKIDGSQYEGRCACLVGTLANSQKIDVDKICEFIPFYEKGVHNAGEAWFLNINQGDTPEKNEFAAHVLKLIEMVETGVYKTITYTAEEAVGSAE